MYCTFHFFLVFFSTFCHFSWRPQRAYVCMSYFLTLRFRRVWANWLKRSGCPSSSLILPPPHPLLIILGCSDFSTFFTFVIHLLHHEKGELRSDLAHSLKWRTTFSYKKENSEVILLKVWNDEQLSLAVFDKSLSLSFSTCKRKPVLINEFQPDTFKFSIV